MVCDKLVLSMMQTTCNVLKLIPAVECVVAVVVSV